MLQFLTEGTGGGAGGGASMIIMLVLMVGIFYFMLIRPENKRKKEAERMRSELKTGDRITTIGGITGTVVSVKDDKFVIETGADQVRIEFAKWALSTNDSAAEAAQEAAKKAQEAKAKAKADAEAKAEALAIAEKLKACQVKIAAKGGEGGKLFGAITGAAIADALQAQHGLTIDGKKLVLDQPIKSFGSYEVKARLGYEVSGTVYVHVIEEK